MIMFNQNIMCSKSGFTIIEVLLYLSLSVVMVALMGGIGVNVMSGMLSTKAEEELEYSNQFITETIRRIGSEATAIESPLSGEASSSLMLSMLDTSKNPTLIQIRDNQLIVQQGASAPLILSGRNIVVSDIEFSNVTYEGGEGSVRMELSMGLVNPSNRTVLRASTTAYTTINMKYP